MQGFVVLRTAHVRFSDSAAGPVMLRYFARPGALAPQLRITADAAVAEQGALVRAARLLEREQLARFGNGLRQAQLTSRL